MTATNLSFLFGLHGLGFLRAQELPPALHGDSVAPAIEGSARPADAAPAEPERALLQAIRDKIGHVYATCKDAVVRIQAEDEDGPHLGTGFFIDASGTIFTHYSVAGGDSTNFTVAYANKNYAAKRLVSDPRSGTVLMKIDGASTPFLPLGRSDAVEVAAPVVALGYPMDLPVAFSFGYVAGFDQQVLGGFLFPAHIRVNVLVQPGESGSPLLNLRGEVVGILVGRLGNGGACYALPIKAAEKIRRDYLRFGEPRPGFVGVAFSPPPDLVNEENVQTRVSDLAPDAPAAHCGLRNGDTLLQIGDTSIRRPSDVLEASFYITAGDNVPITVLRDGEKLTIRVPAVDRVAAMHPPSGQPASRLSLEKTRP